MFALAAAGVLPFFAYVQVREGGQWTSVAQGSSVEWLTEAATEEAAMFGESRVVSQYGDVLERFGS